jgi:uncharacterized membrane protein YcaP (DUF421 family)
MCHETMWHLCIPATEKIVRTVAVYAFLVVALRIAGKRQLAQFNAFDLVVLITISNAVQNAIIGPENSVVGGFIGAATLLATNHVVALLAYRIPPLRTVLQGREDVLYRQGKVNQRAAARERITPGELLTAARRQGAHSLDEVEEIALEPNGNIVVTLKREAASSEIMAELRRIRALLEQR